MELSRILKFIYSHPYNSNNKWGGIIRFIKWQINCKLNPYPIVYRFTKDSKLIMWKGLSGATGNLYCGLLEWDDMGFLLHFLRSEDLFIDIGANVGAYTVLASAQIGSKSIAIEPVLTTFRYLSDNIAINGISDKVRLLNIGIGDQKGILKFTKSLDTVNHVSVGDDSDAVEVKVESLDNVLSNHESPSLIKIDVEGFETKVISGADRTLSAQSLKALIIELNGSGMRYGFHDEDIHSKLLHYGFQPYSYNPGNRKLIRLESYGPNNTIYIRDLKFVEGRLIAAPRVPIGDTGFAL